VNAQQSRLQKSIKAFGIFAALFIASLVLLPFVAVAAYGLLPEFLSDHLLFWPQYLIAPNGLRGSGFYIGVGTSGFIAIALWCLIGAFYGWLTRDLSVRAKILMTYPTIILIVVIVYMLLGVFGLEPNLEGP